MLQMTGKNVFTLFHLYSRHHCHTAVTMEIWIKLLIEMSKKIFLGYFIKLSQSVLIS